MGFEIKTGFVKSKPSKTGRVRFEFIMDSFKDEAIIKKLNAQRNKADYIRNLIVKDIEVDTQSKKQK